MEALAPFQLASEVEEEILDNGLKVLLRPMARSSVVSCWVLYRVGSRNEHPGITGASHWCEHMLFKGGGKLAKGDVHTLVGREGGRNNAFTDQDVTAYFETLPREQLETALFIESERMAHSAFDPQEVASERQVIISEREGSENYPSYQVREEVFAAAFREHPYRWPVVGWKRDLQSMSREELYSHYQRYYHPDNAVLVICGQFETEKTRKLVHQYFGAIPRGEGAKAKVPIEPEQQGARASSLAKPGTLNYLGVGYHLPASLHADTPSLMLLSTILGGWRGLIGFSAGRYVPRSNRLYKTLVEGKLASEVSTSFPVNIDPGLLFIGVTVLPGVPISSPLEALLSQLEALADANPGEKEMEVARNQIKAWHAYENDGATLQAQSLGLFEILGDRRLGDQLVSQALTVTPEQIKEVARKYLLANNRTICTFEAKRKGTDPV